MIALSFFSSTFRNTLLGLFFGSCFLVNAQNYWHTTVWSRVLVSKQINKHWYVSAEEMYRRQNDFHHNSYNFLDNPLLDAQRIVVAYRLNKWQFAFAPSRWHAYQILGKEADFLKIPTTEWRFTPTVEFFQPIGKGIFSTRIQYEFRYFKDRQTGRLRQRIQYRFPLSKTQDFLIGNEFLEGAAPNSSHNFEQDQLNFLWLPKITKHLEAELGYRYIYRKRRNSTEQDNENALVAGLFVRL